MRISIAAAVLCLASTAMAADAPAPQLKPSLVRGTVEKFDAGTLTVRTAEGTDVTATITPASRFATVEKRAFGDLKPTDFVGITAVPGVNGHLRAEEVHVIPVVGLGEGQYPWNHHPSGWATMASGMGSMTNGSIAAVAQPPMMAGSMTNGTVMPGSGNWQLSVSYHGAQMMDGKCEGRAVPGKPGCMGTAIVDVSPLTPIEAIVAAKKDDVKPGLAVVAGIGTDDAGHAFLASATVEKNGVKPEF